MTDQVMVIIISLIMSNFLIAISKGGNDKQKRVKMTIYWCEYLGNGVENVGRGITIYDTDYTYQSQYEYAEIVLHNDSEILGLKKGKYRLINGEFVSRMN